ncbi:nestin [Salminus brasiliensis]|uniref:nestin n=1 Tax=Salminus brasiliensis TaxID=930266 RepID=UPI003B8310F8
MEITSVRQLLPHVGEEKYQMLELNRRLESYLGRVKLLEEENQLLRGEIQALHRNRNTTKGQKQIQEEALNLARREVQAAWMEKDRVEMEVSNLLEEMEALNAQRQKERAAQDEAKRKLAESKKKFEDEWRTQIWLREQAAHLEKEVTLQVQVHQEEMESLKSTTVLSKPVLMAPQHKQTFSLRELGEDYSQRAAQAWQEAAGVYQRQVEQLEDSLTQARAHMAQISQEKKENQLHVQDLAKEIESTKAKRELLEKNVAQQRSRQNQELQKLQAQVEGLEAEKVDLREQIGDLLVDRRNLLQMKMCLGLEVATYRALLDTESLRVHNQSSSKTSVQTASYLEALSKPHRTHPGTQATSASSHFSSLLSTTSRSISHSKADLMTPVLSQSLTQSTQETPKRVQMTEMEKTALSEETTKLEGTSTTTPTGSLTGTGSVPFPTEEAQEASYDTAVSVSVVPIAVDGLGSIPSSHVEEDSQEIPIENQSKAGQDTSGTEEAALISLPAGHLSSLPQTPEREVSFTPHTEDTKGSDNEEEEETEVSTEMAQISHAPMFAWEENDTAVPEEKDEVSEVELELVSQTISDNYTQECSVDAAVTDSKQLGENTEDLASPLFEQMMLHSREMVDIIESASNVPEEELLEIEPEIENVSVERCERMDRSEEMKDEVQVDHCGTEVQEDHCSDVELQEEKNETSSETEEKKVEERKEENVTNGDEEEKVEEDFAFRNGSLTNAGYEDMVKDSSDPEREVNLHGNSEPAEQAEELMIETYDKEHMLDEDHTEEDKIQSDEDESLNISASWRTDPGEVDSYAQENTLADTRPLIHYKSDEEAEANAQASHMGVSEPSDSEEEREKHEGVLMWGQTSAKRFDTMEDLSEEPEIIKSDDVVMNESQAQTVVEENVDEIPNEEPVEPLEDDLQGYGGDPDIIVNTLTDDSLMDPSVNDSRNFEESGEDVGLTMEETEKESNQELNQDESLHLQDWSQSFLSETKEANEQHTLPGEQPSIDEDDTATDNENTENVDMDFFTQNKSEDVVKTNVDHSPLLTEAPQPEEAFQEEAPVKEPCEMPPTETSHSDVFPFETPMTKEKSHTKEEEDEQSNQSTLTHADFTDYLSLHSGPNSRPDSQTNVDHSDLEESNSSEDESPNASQCSQLLGHSEVSTEQLDSSNATTVGEASKKNDSVSFTGFLEEAMERSFGEDFFKDNITPQTAEWENVGQNQEEQQLAVEKSSSGMDENDSSVPQMQEPEILDHPDVITGASHDILSAAEDLNEMEKDEASEKMDIFQGNVLNEEPQTKEKENDTHSFFSSSIKEDIWNMTKFEMAATYDSNEPTETERYTPDTLHSNQSVAFGEDWGEMGSLKPANGKPENEISTGQSEEDEEVEEEEEMEEQEMPKAKLPQCKDAKDGVVEAVQSDDSIEEGDSWSSGEE